MERCEVDIQVTTDIPYGNVTDVEITERVAGPEIRFTPHPHGSTEALWFCFRVILDEGKPTNAIRLTLRHQDTLMGGPRAGKTRPVFRRGGADWERLGPGTEIELPDGRWVVSWDVENPSVELDVANCYPYGPDDLDGLLDDTGGAFRSDSIGVSQSGRPICRLSNDYGSSDSDQAGIYIIARQHSGETTGSWTMDGFVREMSRIGESAPLVWIVPFANIDGIIEGDYGKDAFPWDLNRAWTPAPMRHEVLVMRNDIERWRNRCRPVFALDLHSPASGQNEGVFSFIVDPAVNTVAYQDLMLWIEPITRQLGEFAAPDFGKVVHYPLRWGSGWTNTHFESLGIPCLCVETPYERVGERVLTRDDFREIGARIARAVVERVSHT
jgi:hypothetical protein